MTDMRDKLRALLAAHASLSETIERLKVELESATDDLVKTERQIVAEFHLLMDPTGCASVDMFEDMRCVCGHSWPAHRSSICMVSGCPCSNFRRAFAAGDTGGRGEAEGGTTTCRGGSNNEA